MDKYEKIKVVGKGSFGAAWLVKRKSDGKKLIAKEIQLGGMKPKEKDEARNEVRLLSQMKHPNITQYYESCETRGALFIVMEFADGGDLAGRIRAQRGIRMKEDQIMNYFVQICLALNYLHEKHILHRDLKCQNVFLTSNGVIKLGDFGIATVLRNTMALAHTICGTPYYFSPELCQNKPYNNKSDVWALGCILYEITTLQHAFEGQNMKVLMQKIVRGVYPPISNDYTKHLRDLIKSMLMRESRDRPSINAVTRLPYLQGYICTLGKILGENIQEHKSLVSDEVKLAARMEARDRALVNEKERRAKAIDKLQQKDAVVMRDVDEIRKMKADEDKRLAQRMEKMRAEQQVRMKEIQKREMELERQRREQQAEAQKRNEIEKEKQRKVREEEMGKWRERKKQEQKVYEEQEAKRQQLNRIREEKWEKQMQEMEVAAKQRAARESELREEERAKAAGRAFWEVRNAAQQNKLRVENEVQRKSEALHSPTPDSPQPREPSCCGDHHQSPKKRLSEAELLKQQRDAFLVMKREAARNKANLEAGLFEAPARQSNSPAHASHHVSNSPARVQRDNSKRQNSEPTPEERKAAFLEMRREAQRNKLRMEAEMRGGSPSTPSPAEEEAPPPSSPAEAPPPSSPAPASNQDECGDLTEWVNNEAVSEAEVGQDEWVGDYKDMVCHIEALKSSATIARLDDEEFGDSPDEGVNGSGIPQKFQIDGKTLNLPNVKASDPLMYRIEALRMYVSEEISEDNFVKAYKMMVDVEEDANDQVIQEVEHLLGSKPHVMQLISQLIFCEDQFNLEQNKPP